MITNPPNAAASSAAVDLKSGSITLPILRLLSSDLIEVRSDLEAKLGKAPEFFRNAPIIIDLAELDDDQRKALNFSEVLKLVHELQLAPVGMRGGSSEHQRDAQAEKLAVLAEVKGEAAQPQKSASKRPIPPPRQAAVTPTKVIDQPVRSGQRIYAAGGDLIVMAQVSPGAEIMADGNIHVYGSLKGRALAGVQGNLDARIFCTDLQAQLVAIGGHYRTSEAEDASLKGKLVQIHLKEDALVIDQL